MKLHFHKNQNVSGSILLISLGIAVVLGLLLAGYMTYTSNQTLCVARSQTWNAAIVLSEAGVEEALAHLNRGAPYFDPAEATNNLACNGWTDLGNGQYAAPRRFLGQDYYDVTITILSQTPVINSVGFVRAASPYACGAPPAMFAAIGVPLNSSDQSRHIKVNTKIDALFSVAMAALDVIDFNGKNVMTDSFDSVDPNYSDSGRYPANINKTKASGDVTSDGDVVDTLDIGNAKVKGKVKTGPNGTINIKNNGSVGDRAWVEGGSRGIKPGWSANDMNVLFPPVSAPATTWLPAIKSNPRPTIDGIEYDYVFTTDGDYEINNLNGTGNIYVGTNANVRLLVTCNFSMTSSHSEIRIAPTDARLSLYMQGASFKIGGQGVVNDSGNAANFYYFGLPSNTSIDFQGNASFTGAIYAPNAAFKLGGGGNDTYDFVGGSVTRSVTMNGHFKFHYDENLARVGGHRGFVPVGWKEL